MSGRKQVCKRFLNGKCNAHNCKFYHPKQHNHESSKNNKNKHHVPPQNHNHQKQQAMQHTHNTHVQQQQNNTVSDIVYERIINGDDKEERTFERARLRDLRERREQRELAAAKANSNVRIQPIAEIPTVDNIVNPVPKPGSFGAKLNTTSTLQKFDKTKFQDWLYYDMPNIDGISIINLYTQLLKVSEDEILEYCNKTNALIPDIMALLGHGLTNKKWLKELYGRFLGDSYTGIKSFNMKSINDLLTFTLVQIYVQTSGVSDKSRLVNIEHIISLYVCIMRIIGKFGIVLAIDDINTIEKKYASNKYEMFCN